MANSHLFKFISLYWRSFVVILGPLIWLPVTLVNTEPKYRCLYIVLVMATYWVTEALPLPISSMIPIVMFPMMGIMDTEQTCMTYLKSTNVMFLGGIMVAIAVEHCKIHTRMALLAMQFIGCSQRRLSIGLICTTSFASLWISNAAATSMMSPVTMAVIQELEDQNLCRVYEEEIDDKEENKVNKPTKITTCYFLGCAYGASIGGTGTIIGTGTNLTFKGIYETRFPNAPDIDFPKFMLFNLPLAIINTLVTWVWLQCLFMGMFRPNSQDAKNADLGEAGKDITYKVVQTKYKELGPMSPHEKTVGILFILIVLLWFFRAPGFMPGWSEISSSNIKDATPAILVVILMFILPANWTFLNWFSNKPSTYPTKASPSVITWKLLHDKTPWGLVFLLGGGFALAEGGKKSGMSEMIGHWLSGMDVLPPVVILILVCLACQVLTEFTSNVAIANIILPVLAEMSMNIKMHPLYLMLPAAIMCSFAFLLPVGTPPNAIVAGIANISTKDMAIAGIIPKIFTWFIYCLAFPTFGSVIYDGINDFPSWANSTNKT